VDQIFRGLKRFRTRVYPKHSELFEKLALGQRPEALFITCADSRIDPCLLTQTKPGELFICRVIGNIVPSYPDTIGGVSATIEYAVAVLRVADIVVCGHTDCGVMKGALNPGAFEALPSVSRWLRFAQPARQAAEKCCPEGVGPELLRAITEQNVIVQLRNLRTHPAVAEALERNTLKLHGWVYDIGPGDVTAYDEKAGRFLPIPDSEP
jgi:carbonic anhydrase